MILDIEKIDLRAVNHLLKGKCFYCGRLTRVRGGGKNRNEQQLSGDHQTMDHLVPKKDGSSGPGVRVISCYSCNHSKGGLSLEEYRKKVAEDNGTLDLVVEFYGEKLIGENREYVDLVTQAWAEA